LNHLSLYTWNGTVQSLKPLEYSQRFLRGKYPKTAAVTQGLQILKRMQLLGKEMTKSCPVLPVDVALNQSPEFGEQNKIWVLSLTGLLWSR